MVVVTAERDAVDQANDIVLRKQDMNSGVGFADHAVVELQGAFLLQQNPGATNLFECKSCESEVSVRHLDADGVVAGLRSGTAKQYVDEVGARIVDQHRSAGVRLEEKV